jgi:hypothetical protein
MQSLLYAVGVGAGSVPLAAALNWVLKDGLGQLGGVAYAAMIGNRFDADPKRWRMVAALVLDAATVLEIGTPLVPGLFLPVAATANFLKNVAWLSASATRAGIHQSLAVRGNLADVTAKSASQTIAASALGTGVGILLSPLVGTDPAAILAAFSLLSGAHILSVHRSLRSVTLPTLSAARLEMAVAGWVSRGAEGGEGGHPSPPSSPPRRGVRTPSEVRESERVWPWHKAVPDGSGLATGEGVLTIKVGGQLGALRSPAAAARACGTWAVPPGSSSSAPSRYLLDVVASGGSGTSTTATTVHLLFCDEAGWRDVLTGYLHALRFRHEWGLGGGGGGGGGRPSDPDALLATSRAWVLREGPACIAALDAAGWWVGTSTLDTEPAHRMRVTKKPGWDST